MADKPEAVAEPRWRRRKEARPGELLEAALDLFVEHGYAATRMEAVARKAGVTKGTLYLYFPSKEDLFKAVVRETIVAAVARGEEYVATFQGSARDLVRELVREWWRTVGEDRIAGIPKLMMAESSHFPELAQFYHDEVVRRGRRLFATVLERGVAQGEFRPINIQHAVRLASAPILYAAISKRSLTCFEADDFSVPAYLETHVDVFLRGIAAERVDGGGHA